MPEISKRDRDLLDLARKRFAQAAEADEKQRQRELDDLSFYAGEQWSPEQLRARAGQNAQGGLPPVPARPTLTINKVRQPVRQVLNDERGSDFGVTIAAADDFGDLVPAIDDKEIELREGLARRIQRSSEAADARTWAFTRSTIAGRGFYGVMTRFVPGKSFDKEVYVHRFYNQASVSLDPAHEQPDGSDAEWGFVGVDMPWAQYEAEFPKNAKRQKNDVLTLSDADFRALGEDLPGWFTLEKQTRACRVVDYWYTERVPRTLVQLQDGTNAWRDELPDGVSDDQIVNEREEVEKKIKWCKIDGTQILDETDWEGPDLPIVKVLGEELQPYDAERRAEGMVRPARSACQGFNAMVSKWVETIGLAPIPPFQATPDQIQGFEQWYQLAPTHALPYLPYNLVSDNGQPLAPPSRTQIDTPIAAIAGSIQMFDESIQSTTAVPDSRVGRNTDSHLKAARAIQALQQQSEHGTSNFLDNLRRSIRYEGQIINNLLYPIYGKTPGRIVRILTGEGDSRTVRISTPGQPQQPIGMMNAGTPQQQLQQFTLTPDAHFNVLVKVTRAFDSRREQEATVIGDLLNANPQLLTWFGDLFFKNQDGPGHAEMAERAKVMLAPPIQAMLAQKAQGSQVPPEIAQQLAAKDAQIAHAEAAMKEMQGQLQGKQQEIASKEKIASWELQSKEKIAALDREVKLGVAELGAKVDRLELFLQESQLVGARAHESALSAQEHAQTLVEQMAGQAHESGMSAQDAAQTPPEPAQSPEPQPTGA